MKLSTVFGSILNSAIVASMVMVGVSAKAETLVMLADDDITISQ